MVALLIGLKSGVTLSKDTQDKSERALAPALVLLPVSQLSNEFIWTAYRRYFDARRKSNHPHQLWEEEGKRVAAVPDFLLNLMELLTV